MNEQVQLCVTGASVLALVYSVSLNVFRHWVYEDKGMVDTCMDLLINASPFAISQLLVVHCADQVLCNVCGICLTAICIALFIRSYRRGVGGIKFDTVDLEGKVFIITGSNTGIGFSTATEIVRMGGTVILACRSETKAVEARVAIMQETGCSVTRLPVIPLDLCSMTSVRAFVSRFNASGLRLDCLINNAGVMMPDRQLTSDGFETVFTANHLGHFLLTTLLLPRLEESGAGRVVVLTSALHNLPAFFDFDDIMAEKNYSLFGTYGQSKLANILFARELASRLRAAHSTVTVNCVHPGCVITEFTRSFNLVIRLAYSLLYPIMRLFQKNPGEGAASSLFAATSPRLAGVSGQYLFHCRPHVTSAAARSEEAARRLWEESERLVGQVKN